MAKEGKGRTPEGRGDTTPPSMPQMTPPFSQSGHDFTLQAVIEMQKSLGELTAKTDRLISDVKSQGDKIDGVRLLLARIGGGAALLVVLVGIGTALLRFWPHSP